MTASSRYDQRDTVPVRIALRHLLKLGRQPWSSALWRAVASGIACAWLLPKLPRAIPPTLADSVALAVVAFLVLIRWLAGLPDGLARARRAREEGVGLGWSAVWLVVPAELIGMLRLVRRTAAGCAAWITRRPWPPRPDGIALSDRRRGFYDGLFFLNVVSFVVELPMMLVLTHAMRIPLLGQCAVHLGEIAVIAFMLGDRWHVLAGGHVVTSTHLDLMAGIRAVARVPLSAIETIEPLDAWQSFRAWRLARGIDVTDTGVVSVLDTPNVAIRLRPEPGASWTRFQLDRPLPKYLLIYVDDPAALSAAVASMRNAAIPSMPSGT